MTSEVADRDYLVRWRAAVGFALDAGLAEEPLRMLGTLVASIEDDASSSTSTLANLRESLALSVEQQRLLATVLVDRQARLRAEELGCIAWLCTPATLDWPRVSAELDTLLSLGLLRSLDDEATDPRDHRHAPGEGLRDLAPLARALPRGSRPRRTDTEPPPPPAPPSTAPVLASPAVRLRRWELERWAICFRTRQAIHRWILAHRDPFKEFAGNQARSVDASAADALATEAARMEQELIAPDDDGPTALEHIERELALDAAHARVLLYFFLAEVFDVGLAPIGRNMLVALGPLGVEPPSIQTFLGPQSPLMTGRLLAATQSGSSLYTTHYAITTTVLQRIGIDPAAQPAARPLGRVAGELLGELREPRVSLPDVIVPQQTHDALLDALVLLDPQTQARVPPATRARLLYKGKGTTLLFEGPPGTGKTMAAEALAKHLGRRLYLARIDRIEDFMLGNSQKNVMRLFEEAARNDAVLVLDEADSLVASRTPVHQAWDQHRNSMVNLFLSAVEEHDGIVILTTNLAVNLDPALERRLTARVRFGLPGPSERERLWRAYLPSDIAHEAELDVAQLARQYPMSGARIRNAVLGALRKELRRRVDASPAPPLVLREADLAAAAAAELRSAYRDRFDRDDGTDSGEVGELREPQRKLASVVLAPALRTRIEEALVALSPAARGLFASASFLDTFQTGRGVVLLFDGPPGTGKTMTAEAIAGELGRRMYLLSPERVLSKWHGQSERALARVFDEAEALDAVLVLDEADSLLEARTEAGEWGARTANNIVNLLLRRLDESSGTAILITNRATSLDPALERRLAARLTFPLPDAEQRAEILRRHLPEGVRLADDVDLAALARAHPLSGGLLRVAVLSAIRRMVLSDPSARTLDAASLDRALREAASTPGTRPVGFGAG